MSELTQKDYIDIKGAREHNLKGIDVKILSRLLGHADVNITYNLYIHLYGDGFDEMYEALVGNG